MEIINDEDRLDIVELKRDDELEKKDDASDLNAVDIINVSDLGDGMMERLSESLGMELNPYDMIVLTDDTRMFLLHNPTPKIDEAKKFNKGLKVEFNCAKNASSDTRIEKLAIQALKNLKGFIPTNSASKEE